MFKPGPIVDALKPAYTRYEQGDLDGACAIAEDVMRQYPDDATPYYLRGGVFLFKGRRDEAIRDLTTGITLAPQEDALYALRGDAWLGKGDFDAALADYSKAIRLNPKEESHLKCWFDANDKKIRAMTLGELQAKALQFCQERRYAQAANAYREMIRRGVTDYVIYADRGDAYYKCGKYAEALADFNHAIAMKPHCDFYYRRGWTYTKMGKKALALADFKRSRRGEG
jgi:tetratricopeptide (TPR) repeat protein